MNILGKLLLRLYYVKNHIIKYVIYKITAASPIGRFKKPKCR